MDELWKPLDLVRLTATPGIDLIHFNNSISVGYFLFLLLLLFPILLLILFPLLPSIPCVIQNNNLNLLTN
jgi:hypothetical protein